MNKEKQQFYLVDLKILPEAIKKTIKVKEMLENGASSSINEAVHRDEPQRLLQI
jgi:chorismate mutase